MTAHQLAKELLAGPDIPVVIMGWDNHSYDTADFEVSSAEKGELHFTAESDEIQPRDGFPSRPCVELVCVGNAPLAPKTEQELAAEKARDEEYERMGYPRTATGVAFSDPAL